MDYQLGPGPLQVDQNTIDEKIKGDIGIVENGDVAIHAIPKGYYVIWKGDLYVSKTDISSGTTLGTSNLTAKPNGLGAEVAALNSKLKYGHWEAITLPYNVPSDGFISVYLNPSTTAGAYVRLASGGGNPSITAVATTGEPVTSISPVRRNDYYSQQLLTGGSITCRFMPIFQE